MATINREIKDSLGNVKLLNAVDITFEDTVTFKDVIGVYSGVEKDFSYDATNGELTYLSKPANFEYSSISYWSSNKINAVITVETQKNGVVLPNRLVDYEFSKVNKHILLSALDIIPLDTGDKIKVHVKCSLTNTTINVIGFSTILRRI